MVTPRAADVTALSVTGQISRLTSRLEPTASLAGTPSALHERPCERPDSSGMLRSVRASGAWTGSRDNTRRNPRHVGGTGVESYVHPRVSHGVPFIRVDQGLLWAVKETKM